MENFTLAEMGLFCGTLAGSIVSLIFAVQKSRCSEISVCGGLFNCKRIIKEEEVVDPPPEP